MDFVYGLDDVKKVGRLPSKTIEWWCLAKKQLQAATATLLDSCDKYAVIQNCCISAELLLKGALMATGIDETTLKKGRNYGHKLENLANKTTEVLPNIDKDNLLFVVQQFPDYAESRYKDIQASRLDIGRFLMNTQFISGEILRQFSPHNLRANFTVNPDETWNLTHRTFPKPTNTS